VSEFKLSKKSLSKLEGVNEDLIRVVKRAITIALIAHAESFKDDPYYQIR
jgi:hypothetical protein